MHRSGNYAIIEFNKDLTDTTRNDNHLQWRAGTILFGEESKTCVRRPIAWLVALLYTYVFNPVWLSDAMCRQITCGTFVPVVAGLVQASS